MSNPVYRLASEEEAKLFFGIARFWENEQNPSDMFRDARGTALAAVAEFQANQHGLTLYKSAADRKINFKSGETINVADYTE